MPKLKINRAGLVLLWIVVLLCSAFSFAEPNPYEKKIINDQILGSFQNMMDMWKEELYFDMYELGQKNSQKLLSKVEFAQRMVDLYWKPSLEGEKVEKVKISYRTAAEIHVVVEFENKVNPLRHIKKKMVLMTVLEDEKWKFDLTQLIKIPYAGSHYVPQEPKPKAEPKKKPALDETQDTESNQTPNNQTNPQPATEG